MIVGVGTFFGVRAYNNYIMQQQIEKRTEDIQNTYAEFEAETDREAKLKILSDFITSKPSTADETSLTVLEAIEPLYIETLSKMRQYFIDGYNTAIDKNTFTEADISEDREKLLTAIDTLLALGETVEDEKSVVFYSDDIGAKDTANQIESLIIEYRQLFISDYNAVLKENTFDDTDKVKDKDKLNQTIKNLSALKDLVEAEREKIFGDDDTYSELINMADDLISKYQTRIEDIEKAEEEAKKAEEKNNSSNYSDYNDYDNFSGNNYNSGSDSSSSSGNSGSSGNSSDNSGSSGWTRTWESGNGHITYIDDRTGQAWDDQGNTWNFWDIQREN